MYTPQSGLPEAVKEHFYDQLQRTVTKVPATEIPILVGDWNSHVGADAGAYYEVHGGHGFGNTLFKKRNSHLITYRSGNLRSQVDYILYRKSFRSAVRNVKVIPSEDGIVGIVGFNVPLDTI